VPLDQRCATSKTKPGDLPQGFTVDYAGESLQLRTEGGKFLDVPAVGILIYLVLAAQFESFRDPFIVRPVGAAGGVGRAAVLVPRLHGR